MVYRVRRFLADGSRLVDTDNCTNLLRVSKCSSASKRPFQDFTICEIEHSYVTEEACGFLGEGYALFGLLGLPIRFDKSDITCFYLVLDTDRSTVGQLRGHWVFKINEATLIPIDDNIQASDDVVSEVKRQLGSGSFFYTVPASPHSKPYDLTQNTQDWYGGKSTRGDYLWNASWTIPFLHASVDCRQWTVPLICGSVEAYSAPVHNFRVSMFIISRMSSCYCGTRFCTRGINDYGHVANFVESEQIVSKYAEPNASDSTDVIETSFLIIRGSVPLFWSQSSLQVGHHRIRFNRSPLLGSRAFVLHFKRLSSRYGQVLPLSLLSGDRGERELNIQYRDLVSSCASVDQLQHSTPNARGTNQQCSGRMLKSSWSICAESPLPLQLVHFDYHEHFKNVRNMSAIAFTTDYMLKHNTCVPVMQFLHSNGHFLGRNGQTIIRQGGVIRVNCIDCLDRTNCVQAGICSVMLLTFQLGTLFDDVSPSQMPNEFLDAFNNAQNDCWLRNGDAISRIYTGTGALSGKSRAGDVKRSISRVLQNSLFDASKNVAIESLVLSFARSPSFGKNITYHFNPKLAFADEGTLLSLTPEVSKMSKEHSLRLSISTWNINGDKDQATETNRFDLSGETATLNTWLMSGPQELLAQQRNPTCPIRATGHVDQDFTDKPVDIYAIGFQEVCDITATSVVKASEANMVRWHEMIRSLINRETSSSQRNEDAKCRTDYILIAKDQLVGIGLFVFVRRELAVRIRHLCTTKVKTGFMNSVGNKGCVATRFCIYNASLCFICAHFNAGQKEIELRNEDYASIMSRLSTSLRLPVLDHSLVLFFGDFNYRINLPRQDVLNLIKRKEYLTLLSADQLNIEKSAHKIFHYFVEGPILFNPTYKYDYHCQEYDTSEKARIPSWCDRILWARPRLYTHSVGSDTLDTASNADNLMYYGRAELMTSDHRPVTGIMDSCVKEIDEHMLIKGYIEHRRAYPCNHTVLTYPSCKGTTSVSNQLTERKQSCLLPKQVYERIVGRFQSQIKHHFIISNKHSTAIHMFFIDPVEAKLFVGSGDEFTEETYTFDKRLAVSDVDSALRQLEQLLLFRERCQEFEKESEDVVGSDKISDEESLSSAIDELLLICNEHGDVTHTTGSSSEEDERKVEQGCLGGNELISPSSPLPEQEIATHHPGHLLYPDNISVSKDPWESDAGLHTHKHSKFGSKSSLSSPNRHTSHKKHSKSIFFTDVFDSNSSISDRQSPSDSSSPGSRSVLKGHSPAKSSDLLGDNSTWSESILKLYDQPVEPRKTENESNMAGRGENAIPPPPPRRGKKASIQLPVGGTTQPVSQDAINDLLQCFSHPGEEEKG